MHTFLSLLCFVLAKGNETYFLQFKFKFHKIDFVVNLSLNWKINAFLVLPSRSWYTYLVNCINVTIRRFRHLLLLLRPIRSLWSCFHFYFALRSISIDCYSHYFISLFNPYHISYFSFPFLFSFSFSSPSFFVWSISRKSIFMELLSRHWANALSSVWKVDLDLVRDCIAKDKGLKGVKRQRTGVFNNWSRDKGQGCWGMVTGKV